MSKKKMEESPLETLARTNALLRQIKGTDTATNATTVSKQVAEKLAAIKQLLCRKCKKPSDSRICDSCKRNGKAPKDKIFQSGKGYKYTYNQEGNVVLLGRHLMAEYLGRPLEDFEQVIYKDGNRKNCSIENLELTLKSGISISKLHCSECGAKNWKLDE